MEKEAARRRIKLIAAHFTPTNDDDVSDAHLLPLNCSSTLNSVVRRCDSRMYFARQGSNSQACFMKQGSLTQPDMPLQFFNSEAPMFSRPARTESNFPNECVGKHSAYYCDSSASDPPKFARPGILSEGRQFYPKSNTQASELNGIAWSPRMDAAECGHMYVVTVELPGVGINDIRVEVNDKRLTVAGNRSTPWRKVTSFSNDLIPTYNKKEISQGQYQVVWPLPVDVNKDRVSAEFKDGILQIIIPKL